MKGIAPTNMGGVVVDQRANQPRSGTNNRADSQVPRLKARRLRELDKDYARQKHILKRVVKTLKQSRAEDTGSPETTP